MAHQDSTQRRTSVFVVSAQRARAQAAPTWRFWVRHVASGADAVVIETADLTAFVNACLGVSAFAASEAPGCSSRRGETSSEPK